MVGKGLSAVGVMGQLRSALSAAFRVVEGPAPYDPARHARSSALSRTTSTPEHEAGRPERRPAVGPTAEPTDRGCRPAGDPALQLRALMGPFAKFSGQYPWE